MFDCFVLILSFVTHVLKFKMPAPMQFAFGECLRCRITLQQDDPRWVGAWWVGYLTSMVAILLIAPVFFGYPPDPSTSLY